jgi:hypothetical protein
MENTNYLSVFSILNLAVFAAVLVVNTMAATLPLNGIGTGELSDLYPNLFVPSGLTFSIWGIIYILLGAFSIYGVIAAFNNNIDTSFLTKIGPWFIFSSAANICWIFAWHWKKIGLSLIIMLILLFTLIVIYKKIDPAAAGQRNGVFFLTRLPFSVYLGWITVATIANATALFVNINWDGFGLSDSIWTIIVITTAVLITCLVIYNKKDWGYSLVVLWAFLGIILKRSSAGDASGVLIAAITGMAFITVFFAVRKFLWT